MELARILNVFLPAARAAYQPSNAAGLPSGFAEAQRIRTASGQDFGFVAFSAVTETALIAIRGTQDVEDWIHDVDALPVFGAVGLVHQGFRDAYAAIRSSILDAITGIKPKRVWVVGHSLGGALAIACSRDFFLFGPLEVVTFAAPRFGDRTFEKWFNGAITNCTRIENRGDLVPQVPTDPPYSSVGAEIPINGGFRILDPKFAHSLDQYEAGLRKLAA